jgi:hypothetical protein
MSGFGATAGGATAFSPGLPTIGVRLGLVNRVDVGARVSDLTGVGADLKYNFVRGRFDMAIDPAVQGIYYDVGGHTQPAGVAQFHLPLLLGLNFDEDTTLVLTPGFFAAVTTYTGQSSSLDTLQFATLSPGLGARLGLGLNVRASDNLSWQPELTVWHEFGDIDSWVYVLGIGLNVGALPDYSDLAGSPSP